VNATTTNVATKLLGFSIYRLPKYLKDEIYEYKDQHPQIRELLDTRTGEQILHENSMFDICRNNGEQLAFVIGKLQSDSALLKVAVSYCKFVDDIFAFDKF
jgi:hypothetical protein